MNALLQKYAKINDKQKIDWSKQFIVLKYAKQISQNQYPNLNIDTLLVVALHHLDYDKTLDESVEDYITLFNYDNAKQANVNVNPTIFIFDSNSSQQQYLDWMIDETRKITTLYEACEKISLTNESICSVTNCIINKTNCSLCPFFVYGNEYHIACAKNIIVNTEQNN